MVMSFCIRSMASWFTTWAFTFVNIFIIDLFADHLVIFPDLKASSSSVVFTVDRSSMARTSSGNTLIMGRGELCAILPVYLVAVVFRRIVACSDIDAGDAAQLTHCKGKLRRGTQGLKLVGLDPVGRQGAWLPPSANSGDISPGIKGNGNALVLLRPV